MPVGSSSTLSSVRAPWGTHSCKAATTLQGAGASDGYMHPKVHLLLATPSQLLLWEWQGTGPRPVQLLNLLLHNPTGRESSAGTCVRGTFQPSALAPGLQHTLVLPCPSLSRNDAEELSPSLSGLCKSTASSHALLPLAAQTPTLTFANRSPERKRSTRAVVCPQPALQSSRL